MKLNDYFKQQKYQMKDEDKLIAYEKFVYKIRKDSIFYRISFYVKVWVYTLFLLFLFFSLFAPWNNLKKWIFLQYKNTVYADYIGKVITSTWGFEIYENWKLLNTNLIKKWNIL